MAHVLITGAGAGIGMATALELARAGHTVFATMRDPVRLPELGRIAATEGLPISVHVMDVNSDESVKACFAALDSQGAAIDVLVNNAGIESHSPIEEQPLDGFKAVMETNYFGAIRCIHQVLRPMRERGSGCIVNVSSVSGRIAGSPLGAYTASKHALEALSEVLAGEVKPFGVRVAIVEPGIIDTRMAHAIETPPASRYQQVRNMAALFQSSLSHPTPPSVVAKVIREVIESGTWQLRHPAGPDAAPFLAWRASLSDEEWVTFNSLDAQAYKEAVKASFGMDVDL